MMLLDELRLISELTQDFKCLIQHLDCSIIICHLLVETGFKTLH